MWYVGQPEFDFIWIPLFLKHHEHFIIIFYDADCFIFYYLIVLLVQKGTTIRPSKVLRPLRDLLVWLKRVLSIRRC